jgi:hypothetical protein
MNADAVEGAFQLLALDLERDCGAVTHLVRVKGERWSFVSGKVAASFPCQASLRVRLDDEWALVLYPLEGKEIDPQRVRSLFEQYYTRETL